MLETGGGMERRTLDSCGKERENGDPAAQWNERVQTNQKDGNGYCSSLRSNHFVMSQTLFVSTKKQKNFCINRQPLQCGQAIIKK